MARGLGGYMARPPLPLAAFVSGMPLFSTKRLPTAFEYRLRDGTLVLVRWVSTDDAPLFRQGFKALSEQSRLRRFFSAASELSDKQIRYFTHIDHINHMAWGARNLDHRDQPGMAVARYIRAPDQPEKAEVAITVVDEYQNRGLGTVLFAALNYSAAEHGIKHFTFEVLEENTGFIHRLKAYGGKRRSTSHGVVQIEVPVRARSRDVPDGTAAGQALRSAMRDLGKVSPSRRPEMELIA